MLYTFKFTRNCYFDSLSVMFANLKLHYHHFYKDQRFFSSFSYQSINYIVMLSYEIHSSKVNIVQNHKTYFKLFKLVYQYLV